jgi:predicted AlkP superfamily phosphohydrolase/phosphomutase
LLLAEGFMNVKKDFASGCRYALFRLGLDYYSMGKLVLRLGLGKQAVQMGRGRRQDLQEKVFFSFRDVDWARTKAYSMGNYGQIFVNLKGREPKGCVSPGAEYEEVLNELTERLHDLVDEESGDKIIDKVFRREEVYSGRYVERAADLMFLTKDMEYKALGLSDFNSPRTIEPVFGCTGNHRMKGMLALRGEGAIREGGTIDRAAIQDLAPTILYLLGVPIPTEMDGIVLQNVFTPDFRMDHQPRYEDSQGRPARPEGSGYSPEEEEELTRMLKGLGYV